MCVQAYTCICHREVKRTWWDRQTITLLGKALEAARAERILPVRSMDKSLMVRMGESVCWVRSNV